MILHTVLCFVFHNTLSVLAVIQSLLMSAGDIEANPGPDEVETSSVATSSRVPGADSEVIAFLTRLEAGQKKLLQVTRDIQLKQKKADDALAAIDTRMAKIEQELVMVHELKTDVEQLKAAASENSALTTQISRSQDDLENRLRRNNLLFFGLADKPSETWHESELAVLKLVSESLQVPLESSLIDRAHRIGKFQNGKQRPIIVCFNQFKVKEAILYSAPKLKGQKVSISEDYSQKIVYARKRLIEYAKNTNATYRLRFDKMFIGNKCFIFDDVSNSVIECTR